MLNATGLIDRSEELRRYWAKRNEKFKSWYEQLQMADLLKQKDMESFVGNDPRASFNLVSSILNQRIPHRLRPDVLTSEEVRPAATLSSMFNSIWENVSDDYRQRGRYFQKDLIDFLLATGWYSVFASITLDGSECVAEVWNPATVFPRWEDTLTECAHIFSPGESHIRKLATRNNWELRNVGDKDYIRDYWRVDDGVVYNGIAVGSQIVKALTPEPRFRRIPIFVAPAGGLPDDGSLSKQPDTWRGEVGQSFIATNENIYKTSNKWWTFILQILRDTAQAKTYERTTSAKNLVTPENWYRRGAHFKLGPNDEIGYISPPSIPVELRSTQLDLEAMMQRGGPSWTMFGSIQAQMTAYAMSQVVATTNQISRYYHQAVIDCLTDIDNFWYQMMKEFKYKPYGLRIPEGLPPKAKLTAEYELRIPGDLVQRATTARILNPAFELSDERIMEELFPEIKNPAEELAKVSASKARKHPAFTAFNLIQAFKEDAELLRRDKDFEGSDLCLRIASSIEQSIAGGQQPPPSSSQVPLRSEAIPPATAEMIPPGTM